MIDSPCPTTLQSEDSSDENAGHSPVSMFSCDGSMRLKWSKNLPAKMDGEDFLSMLEHASIEGVSSRRMSDAMRWVAKTGDSFYGFCVAEIDGTLRRFEVSLYSHTNNHIVGVATDLGANDPRERAVRSLSLELAHRTKNLMAVISSLATQTARRFDTAEDFKRRFLGQIGSLSLAHDAIAKTGWSGAPLERIVRSQIEQEPLVMRAVISGDALGVMLSPNAAQNIAMVVHDLASACAKGASFKVHASFDEDGRLLLTLVTRPPLDEQGLWRDLLEKVAPLALDGIGKVHIDDDVFSYALTVSEDHYTRP